MNIIPDNLIKIKNGSTTIFVRCQYRDSFLKLYVDHLMTLKKGKIADSYVYVGRGGCLSTPLGNCNNERVVIRRYRHGGLLWILVRDIFWNLNRPFNELAISEIGLKNGLNTSEVVAIVKQDIFFPFYKAELVTKEIINAFDLINGIRHIFSFNGDEGFYNYKKDKGEDSPGIVSDILGDEAIKYEILNKKKTIIKIIADTVKKMHDIGIYHRDLHLKNILLKKDGDNLMAYIIDMDKAVILSRMDIMKRLKNLYRLDRSLEKLVMILMIFRNGRGSPKTFPISKTDRVRFFKEYINGCQDINSGWKAILRDHPPNYNLHKLWWNIADKFGILEGQHKAL